MCGVCVSVGVCVCECECECGCVGVCVCVWVRMGVFVGCGVCVCEWVGGWVCKKKSGKRYGTNNGRKKKY